ncbi:MAG: M20 metallopeptidase family protein [Gemmatimonadales bacterium]
MTPLPPVARDELVATRRDLHAHPELGFEETRTAALVAARLERLGYAVWNEIPVGTIGLMAGPVMAAVDRFDVTIHGRGGHAAAPHQAVDPVVVAAHVVTALQTPVSRARDPAEEAVVSVTAVRAGEAFNVIPDRAGLCGTVRSFPGRFHEEAPALVRRAVEHVARAFGAQAEVRYAPLSGPVVNDPAMTELMRGVAAEIVGPDAVLPGVRTLGGEDMAFFLAAVPGAFAFVGSAPRGRAGAPHHSPGFDIDEDALVIGTELLTRTAARYLETVTG